MSERLGTSLESLLTAVVGDRYKPFDVIEVEVVVPPPIPRSVSQAPAATEQPKPATVSSTEVESEPVLSTSRRRMVWENPTPTVTRTTGPAVLRFEEYIRQSGSGMCQGSSCPGLGRRAGSGSRY